MKLYRTEKHIRRLAEGKSLNSGFPTYGPLNNENIGISYMYLFSLLCNLKTF